MEYKGKKVYAVYVHVIYEFIEQNKLTYDDFEKLCGLTHVELYYMLNHCEMCDEKVFDKVFAATNLSPKDVFRFTVQTELFLKNIRKIKQKNNR